MADRDLLIRGASVVLPEGIRQTDVLLAEGKIVAIGNDLFAVGIKIINGEGCYLSAGWIDLQCNGGFGDDFTSDPTTIWPVAAQLPRFGVTAFLPTIITAPLSQATAAQAVLQQRPIGLTEGSIPLGLHVEGPYLNPQKKGAHNPTWLRPPNVTEVVEWRPENGVCLVTLAPELYGATEMIRCLVANGVVVSAGHSVATFDEAMAAFELGVRYGTHLFNAMPVMHHREPGLVGALLHDSRPTIGLIPDGVHVHPALCQTVWQSVGKRINIVTDAMAAMGLGRGEFVLGDHVVTVLDGEARLASGTLAGSVVTLDVAVQNFWRWTGCSIPDVLATVTSVPADLLGLDKKGKIARGCDGDLVLVDENLDVVITIIDGKVRYDRNDEFVS